MAKVHVVAKRDHLQSLTAARPLAAVAELATYSYRIIGNADTIDDFDASEPFEVKDVPVGTEVAVYNLARNFRSLVDDSAPMELAKIFAAYLTEYPDLNIEYNGISECSGVVLDIWRFANWPGPSRIAMQLSGYAALTRPTLTRHMLS